MKYPLLILSFIAVCLLSACSDPPNFSETPQIEFLRMSKQAMQQNSVEYDSVAITISFTDGDGNIGSNLERDTLQDLFIRDTRFGFVDKYRIPEIDNIGSNNGLSGEITIFVENSCCISNFLDPCSPTPDIFPSDEIIYEIQIMDRDSNMSNLVQSIPLTLYCN